MPLITLDNISLRFSEKIILELVKLSEPNNLEKTIFIFPEGVFSNISLKDLKKNNFEEIDLFFKCN